MKCRIAIGLLAGVFVGIAPAHAQQDGDFCTTLKAAWTAGKNDPKSLAEYKIAGANRCAVEDNGDLLCTWVLDGKAQGRDTYERFKTSATTCLAPLGLKPVLKTLSGIETTSLETPTDAPNVAIFYPGGSTVTISIVTSQ